METMFRMKNIKNLLLLGALGVFALSSCVSENVDLNKVGKEMGALELNVDVVQPQTRAITEVDDFPVYLYDAEGKLVDSWSTVPEVPEKITLSVGDYVVESHTPGVLRKQMTSPYYKGTKAVEVLKGITSAVDVICKMENSPITVSYADDFTDVFSSWEITIDDSEGGTTSTTALSFTNTSSTAAPVYMYYGENGVKELKVNFRGVTKEGSTVVSRNTLTKDQADTHYDNDRENFAGGDALRLEFKPVESSDGKIKTITINAEVTFTETNEDINVVVVDKSGMDDPGNDPEPPTPPTPGDDDKITLNLPAPISYPMFGAASVDKSLGDTQIAAQDGLKSIVVKVDSSSPDMLSSLGDLKTQYGVDFVGGAEIVENQDVVTLFNDLNQPLSVPNEGDKSYTFPIGNFFGLLQVLQGEHIFNLTVTDMNGQVKTGKVVITILPMM